MKDTILMIYDTNDGKVVWGLGYYTSPTMIAHKLNELNESSPTPHYAIVYIEEADITNINDKARPTLV